MTTSTQLKKEPPAGFQVIMFATNIEARKMVEQGKWTKTIHIGQPFNHRGPVMICCFNLRQDYEGISRWCGVAEIEDVRCCKLSELTEADWIPAGSDKREQAERTIFEQHYPWTMDCSLTEKMGGKSTLLPAEGLVTVSTWKLIKSYDLCVLEGMLENQRIYHPDAFSEWVKSNPGFVAAHIDIENEVVQLMEAWARTIASPCGLPTEAVLRA